MDLPEIVIPLKPTGLDAVKTALKGVKDAIADVEKSTSAEAMKERRIREGIAKAEADAKVREFKRSMEERRREAQKEADVEKNIFGDVRRTSFSNKGLREYSSSQAFEQALGKSTAQLIGLHGTAGIAVGALHLFQSGLSLAASALTQFGGFILSDIVKPQLELGTKSQQIANRMTDATGAGVRDTINELFKQNAQAELPEITKVFEIAASKTKNQSQAQQVADLALQANKAYGFDAAKMAEFIGGKAAANPDLSPTKFEALISSQIAASMKGASTPEQFIAQQGKIENMLTRFAGTGTADDKAGREIGIANLLNAATGKGGSATKAVTGLDHLVEDLARDRNHPAFKNAIGPGGSVDLVKGLTSIVATTKGDLMQLGAGPKAGSLANVQIGALNKSSIDFIRSLGLADTYKAAGGGAAGEQAVTEQLKRILDPAEGASKLAEDVKKVEADTGYKLDQAMRTLKGTLIDALLPVLEKEGPKVAEVLANLANGIAEHGGEVGAAFEAAAKMVATVIFGLADVMDTLGLLPKGAADAKAKLGAFAGIQGYGTHTYTGEDIDKKLAGPQGLGITGVDFDAATGQNAKYGAKAIFDLMATGGVKRKSLGDFSPLEQQNFEIEGAKQILGKGAVNAAVNPNTGQVDIVQVAALLKAAGHTLKEAGDKFVNSDPARFLSQDKRSTT